MRHRRHESWILRSGACACLLALAAGSAVAHESGPGRELTFPDIEGAVSLVCDLHTHSVFSDGSVWPDIRIREAIRDDLDCISLTEHLEYQPHAEDIPHPDRNRAHEVAVEYAEGRDSDLIIIRGSEITRQMPPGHANAVFIEDANKLLVEGDREVFEEANSQSGFTFWNHPHWVGQQPDGVATLSEMHKQLIADGLIHGVEVVNDITYSDETLQIALDNDLTILGTSDVHGLVDWRFEIANGGHRPVTIVLAEERTPEAIREALFAGRTVAFAADHTLIGLEENLVPLLEASIVAVDPDYDPREGASLLYIEVENRSSARIVARNVGPHTFGSHGDVVVLEPKSMVEIQLKPLERVAETTLELEIMSAVTAPGTHPRISVPVVVDLGD